MLQAGKLQKAIRNQDAPRAVHVHGFHLSVEQPAKHACFPSARGESAARTRVAAGAVAEVGSCFVDRRSRSSLLYIRRGGGAGGVTRGCKNSAGCPRPRWGGARRC